MRIGLEQMLSRFQRLFLPLSRFLFASVPGPVLLVSVKKEFFGNGWNHCMTEGMRQARHWTKPECELFAAFVSRCNACQY